MLEIKNLHVKLADEDRVIRKGVDLVVPKGEVHAIMGPTGSENRRSLMSSRVAMVTR